MTRFNRKSLYGCIGLLLATTFAGCSSSWTIDLSQADHTTAPVVTPAQIYTDWTEVGAGVDFKQVLVTANASEELLDIVRIDPEEAQISFHVQEGEPQTVSDWQAELDATVVINAGYFDEDYELVTRTISKNGAAGPLLSGETGFFHEDTGGWKLSATPQQDRAYQLLQSYPLLVENGEALLETSAEDQAQRTVIAMNEAGMIYFIVAEYGVLTLAQLSQALADLDQPKLSVALNLDGGSSTGLAISSDSVDYLDDSFMVPSVVAIR